MFLSVKNAGWAHTSLWDLYFVESEDIKSKYSSIELLIHEAVEYMKLCLKKKKSESTRIFSLLMLYVVVEARVYFIKHIFL
jgi:3-deoxy-D-arabino-heptulosonate 7-phosphate (DAHP) synthase class II